MPARLPAREAKKPGAREPRDLVERAGLAEEARRARHDDELVLAAHPASASRFRARTCGSSPPTMRSVGARTAGGRLRRDRPDRRARPRRGCARARRRADERRTRSCSRRSSLAAGLAWPGAARPSRSPRSAGAREARCRSGSPRPDRGSLPRRSEGRGAAWRADAGFQNADRRLRGLKRLVPLRCAKRTMPEGFCGMRRSACSSTPSAAMHTGCWGIKVMRLGPRRRRRVSPSQPCA